MMKELMTANNIKECVTYCQADRNCGISDQHRESISNDTDGFFNGKILEFD